MTIGDHYETTAIIVESDLDAILFSQEISREVFIVATGSTSYRPDEILLKQLEECPVILVALDSDGPGAKASKWWLDNLPNAFRTLTPASFGNDIAEAFLNGLDLNVWLSATLELCCDEILRVHPVGQENLSLKSNNF